MTEMTFETAFSKMERFLVGHVEHLLEQAQWVDPREAYRGPEGEDWLAISRKDPTELTVGELDTIRRECRYLAMRSPWAINGLRNRQNYVIGWGHTYKVVGRTEDADANAVKRAKAFVDFWTKAVRWGKRQRETKFRGDRDGEVFLRLFPTADGILKVRYVDPFAIVAPPGARPHQAHGIESDPEDAETIVAYWITDAAGRQNPVDAAEIQHRKFNVDSEVRRGISIIYPVREELRRANRLLRNMGTTAEVQAAIALIRKHDAASASNMQSFVKALDAARRTGSPDAAIDTILRYPPGAILDVGKNVDYEMPGAGVDPSKFVPCLQAELRAVASCWQQPEFMLTADASNANYASTLVAEGPAVKSIEHDQQETIEYDLEIIERALRHGAESGLFEVTPGDVEQIRIEAEPPIVASRDELKDAQVVQTLSGIRAISPQTTAARFGLDYEQERINIEDAEEKAGGPITLDRPTLLPVPMAGA